MLLGTTMIFVKYTEMSMTYVAKYAKLWYYIYLAKWRFLFVIQASVLIRGM